MSLFDHIGFESRNIPASYHFYSSSMMPLELRVLKTAENLFFVSGNARSPLPFLRVSAVQSQPGVTQGFQSGQHLHLKFSAKTHAQVEAFYLAALQAGGRDSGAPSYQGPKEMGYFAALVFDPDGNTVEVGVHERQP
ncbi:VOC family protein [Pseudochrobactrum sp. MP213Fo]|uniref:VOC family protein n=1 Tax=Pseudochrobactrum sp. MP213Fo TaxID=3022250 RepID=UPI003B9F8543